ncbi:MAG TPA: hypothetical protein PLV92_18655, partial [Pirellulaceae bacterium]|nr:hypothetical protein [Pirellulaceae bacterium]
MQNLIRHFTRSITGVIAMSTFGAALFVGDGGAGGGGGRGSSGGANGGGGGVESRVAAAEPLGKELEAV